MPGKKKIYPIKHAITAVFLALTLVWLTVSTPFVFAAQQLHAAAAKAQTENRDRSNDNSNPFANTTEEKTPSSVNLAEEFLHNHEEQLYIITEKINHAHSHHYEVYVAFHGELLSPPPEA